MPRPGRDPREEEQSLPTGVVTFCLTDIEGSTAQWAQAPSAMGAAIVRHQELLREAVVTHAGVLVAAQGEGDSTLSAFERPGDALAAAAAMHSALAAEPWPAVVIRIRIGIHTGEAEIRDGTYYGMVLNHTGRIRSLGRGTQTVVSRLTSALVGAALPDGLTLLDAGTYDLKGLPEPENVYLLAPQNTSEVRLAVPRRGVISGLIPAPPTSFIGRQDSVDSVIGLLGTSPLVTITGPGGAGKTRLGIEAARQMQAAGSSVVLVDLAPIDDAALVPHAVAAAARVGGSDEVDVDLLVEVLAGSDKLFVLDNCEHLIAPVGALVGGVLSRGGAARFLITSQAALGIAGERVVALDSLSVEHGVDLFTDRAKAHDPDLDANIDQDTIVEICDRLDGLPLAIELAAAHTRLLTPEQILERLSSDVLGLSAARGQGVVDRQRTLRAALDWSVGLLTEEERTVLARLSVFQGGCTLQAAEAVCSDDRLPPHAVLDVLAGLVDRSLVARRRRGRESRFWLLETIRAYAWEALGSLPSVSTSASDVILRREGEVWALVSAAGVTRFRDSKGLRYLAELLRHPGVEIAALTLAGRPAEAGMDAIDDRARRAYRERLADLERERDEAVAGHDEVRRARAEVEIDALADELARSLGLDGRSRRIGSTSERGRVSVTKALRQAIARLGAESPDVGTHLDASVTTGTYCRYDPAGPPMKVEL